MKINDIQSKLLEIQQEYSIKAFPVNIDRYIEAAHVELRYDNIEDLSGFAYRHGDTKIIAVNANESEERQRFTIAHELGHIFMHQNKVSFDRGSYLLDFRDEHSSEGTDQKEIDANQFAAELLMPEIEVRKRVQRIGSINLEDEKAIKNLAQQFKVSLQAMTVRLTSLYFRYQK